MNINQEIIAQGAEAIIYKIEKENAECNGQMQMEVEQQETDKVSYVVIKNRIKKGYRIPELDEKIRKQRTKKEANLLQKAGEVCNTPRVLKIDKFDLELEFIKGDKLSNTLNSYPEKKQFEIMQQLGEEVAKLHEKDIIHGDLTTSNTILVENNTNIALASSGSNNSCSRKDKIKNQLVNNKKDNLQLNKDILSNKLINNSNKNLALQEHNIARANASAHNDNNFRVFIIDFGLGTTSRRIEDKAVDLHLIQQALEAKHYQNWQDLFENFLKGYKLQEANKVLEQLKKVEARGRYKH